ncbi:calycin-like domain-containing protein [uncultured Duncaniella sp.]|uniref:calycin-like domain-containing protein n=1 Tax=uncultured Duncaniella sp. TaxID=2768039 RepID=UPI0025D96E3A|nr:calycin-like domain-containing protein [uncultured Duncaniella sp.]
MKSLYATLISSMLISPLCFNVFAQQQLPNADFEGAWVDCVPWTSNNNAKVKDSIPENWCISNVIGIGGTGATTVGGKDEGYNSASSVKLTNSPNPLMSSQIVPAYLTLGTTWSTSVLVSKMDGGTFGGMQFTERPAGMEFMYKRSRGESKPEETSTIVAYLWKGHWTQSAVPANIVMFGSPATVDMVDRDRCVLGMDMSSSLGGDVTKTDDAELIAVLKAEITENTDEWTKFSGKFEYYSDATPEMFNVIIAAGDYFGGASVVGKDNTLIVDDVKLIYADDAQSQNYPGFLSVEMMGSQLADNQPSTIIITPTGDGKCTFLLPDLTLGDDLALGDIKVEDVTMTEANGITTYTGEVKDLSLVGGIIADVAINGTITAAGEVNMKIDVMWQGVPINVTFTSSTSAIGSIEADGNGVAEYFNLQGIRVNGENMTPGVYVKRQGGKVSKVIVR